MVFFHAVSPTCWSALLILSSAESRYETRSNSKNTLIDRFSSDGLNPYNLQSKETFERKNIEIGPQHQQQHIPEQFQSQPQHEAQPKIVENFSNNTQNIATPCDLLPRDDNSQWASLNPVQSDNSIMTPDLLIAGYNIGIDTIGQTLRNPNYQLRSDPIIQKMDIGPWNLSTIEPDNGRVPLEIGACTR